MKRRRLKYSVEPSSKLRWYDHPLFRNIEHVGIVLAICAVAFDVGWRFLVDRQVAAEERIERAWNALTRPVPGASGKVASIGFLLEQGINLQGLDLSCQTMGGGWDPETVRCGSPVWLAGADLSGTEQLYTNFTNADFSGVDLSNALLSHSILTEVNFRGAILSNADFSESQIRLSSLNGAIIAGTDFSGADFIDVDVSGTAFCTFVAGCARNIQPEQLTTMWFWADNPPVFSSDELELEVSGDAQLRICDPDFRPELPPRGFYLSGLNCGWISVDFLR